MPFLSSSALQSMGFARLGRDVQISSHAVFYNAAHIEIGDHSRIDDFCLLSAGEGGIRIGRHVHVACYCSLIGKKAIELADFSGLSSRVSVYSSSDDYSGASLTNPTVPEKYRRVVDGDVSIGRHVIVGAGSVILPGVRIGEGAAVGALSLVRKNLPDFGIYFGVPAKRIGARKRDLLEMETRFNAESNR
jgi:dTDP-4-amino-4,6-dideoxy-D-glucose acyltransferase